MTTRLLLALCWLGIAVMFGAVLLPDIAVPILIAWLVMAGVFQVAALLAGK